MLTITPGTVRLQQQHCAFPSARPVFAGKKTAPVTDKPPVVTAETKPAAKTKKRFPWHLWPLIRIAGYCYTHPKKITTLERIFVPSSRTHHINRRLLVKIFHPIQSVQFKSLDGIRLDGHWIPSKTFSNKTVILGHGYTADFRQMLGVADGLRKAGFNTFLFDFRSHGTSAGIKSSIGYHEGKDVAGALDFVLNEHGKESTHLFYMGHSMGAASLMMSPKSLEKNPEALKKMEQHFAGFILDSPYRSLAEMSDRFLNKMDEVAIDSPALKSVGKLFSGTFAKIGKGIINGFQQVGKNYLRLDIPFEDMRPADIFSQHAIAKKPTLLLHGTLDTVAPYDHGLYSNETLKKVNPSLWFITLKDIGHNANEWDPLNKGDNYCSVSRGGKAYMTYVTTFLNDTIEKNKTPTKAG